jgi:hypothetical protein
MTQHIRNAYYKHRRCQQVHATYSVHPSVYSRIGLNSVYQLVPSAGHMAASINQSHQVLCAVHQYCDTSGL